MAYLVITFDRQEVDRRDLAGPVVIGRAADCDIAIKDILLSRRHCRIEPGPQGWRAVDLDSRNGTTLNGDSLSTARTLGNGNMLRLGRVTVRFQRGSLAAADLGPICTASQRPADPNESLSGTIASFTLLEPGEGQSQSPEHLPLPRPEPRAPAAYHREDVYSLLSTIASSSWDSIYAQAKQPLKKIDASSTGDKAPRSRPRSPIDLSLQVVQAREQPAAHPTIQTSSVGRPVALESSNLFPRMVIPSHAVGMWRSHLPAAAILLWAAAVGVVAIKNSHSKLERATAPASAVAMELPPQSFGSAKASPVRVDPASALQAGYRVGQSPVVPSNSFSEAIPAIGLLLPPLIPVF